MLGKCMKVEDVEDPICMIGCNNDEDCTNSEYICHNGQLQYHFIIVKTNFQYKTSCAVC